MSLDDFLDLSPSEFIEAYNKWMEIENQRYRNEMEKARWTVFKTLCPPDKKQISILDIETFPWEKGLVRKSCKPSTRERFEELKNKWNKN